MSGLKRISAAFGIMAVAACTTPQAPPVSTPPPPVVTPRVPLPPGGAAASTVLPAFGTDGVRITPNRGLSTEEHIWNFRVALNVAALNCRGPVWDEIITNYNTMLKNYKNTLRIVNTNVDREYRQQYGSGSKRVRDSKSTELYNYFALPAVKADYCNTALAKSREVSALPIEREAFRNYAIGGLNDIDRVFLDFYDAYAQYEVDLANWNARYNPQAPNYGQPVIAGPAPTPQPAAVTATQAPVQPAAPVQDVPVQSAAPVQNVSDQPDFPAASPVPVPVANPAPAPAQEDIVTSEGVVFTPGTGTP